MSPFRRMKERVVGSDVWKLLRTMAQAAPALNAAWWLLIVLGGLLPAVLALNFGWVVHSIATGTDLVASLVSLGVIFVVMNSLSAASGAVAGSLGTHTAEWLHGRLMDACLTPEGTAHLENPEFASELSAARDFDKGISGAPLFVSMPRITSRFTAWFAGVAQALVLFAFAWWVPPLLAGAWLSTSALLRKSSRWDGRFTDDIMLKQRRVEYLYRTMVDAPAAKEVRIFGLGRWLGKQFAHDREDVFEQSWKERRQRWPALSRSFVLVMVANATVFLVLANAVVTGSIALAWGVVFAQCAIGLAQLGFEDDYFIHTASQPVPKVLAVPEHARGLDRIRTGTRDAAGMPQKEIRFRDVSFSYPNAETRVLRGFDLDIPAGSSLAIVGHNGAGKTTLMKLLGRLYDPTGGSIEIDGISLTDLELASWRDRIAMIFQDFIRYELSLRDNVAPHSADDEVVLQALASAGAEGLADLDTVMSKAYAGGVDVSGGQWQRIALARAIARIRCGAGLVILDEPTAQLDIRGEEIIFNRLLEETRDVTTILISHRFATVRKVDRICALDDGRVAELGSHEELMALGGMYRKMYGIQAARFDTVDEARTA